eukprot:CAMPEP_0194033496 /NCGR_PEP_ID=MMETSP0009_2-20130614/6171_1 /TAXON_ID=210454 /ORGANISM="Grammatophora oceanica, Strain CCMP 410" /LENGTH=153 /DNA_ID=CAMNT_0038674201 /DNA_START=78 /DNA_END=539 /DNA_ORIENTATION=+
MVYVLPPEPQTIVQMEVDGASPDGPKATTAKGTKDQKSAKYAQYEKQPRSPLFGTRTTRSTPSDLLDENEEDERYTSIKEIELRRVEQHMIVGKKVHVNPFEYISAHEKMVEFMGKRMPSSELPVMEEEDFVLGESIQTFFQYQMEGSNAPQG